MANIFLTRRCNLKCPYCFADEFVNKENEEFTIENFKTVLNFVKTDPAERIGLIGGEPSLYSKFNEVLDILMEDEQVKEAVIFTNGLEIHKYFDKIKNEKFHMLVNCNSAADVGQARYDKLKENILFLKDNLKERFNIGINIYSKGMDYSYIFELLKLADKHNVRFSTALPNDFKAETHDILDSFREMKPTLFSFFKDCVKNEIVPSNDCNSYPDCIMSTDDKLTLIKLAQLSRKYQMGSPIETCHICNPVIDILPDLHAVRCFGLSKYMKAPITDFKTIHNLRLYFYNKIDVYARATLISRECENCRMHLLDKCGVCFTYKVKQMDYTKELLKVPV